MISLFSNKSKPEEKQPGVAPRNDKSVYRIGYTEDNLVILTVGEFPTSASCIMTAFGVQQMIALLEATLVDVENTEETVEDTVEDTIDSIDDTQADDTEDGC